MFSGKARPPGERWFGMGAVEPEALARAALLARGPCPDRPLARHRTGWTARVEVPGGGECCLKVYRYPGLECLRGPFRTTFLCPSRPAREARVLGWLRERGLGAPEPLGRGERRTLGWLRHAWLLTRYRAAPDAERVLARGEGEGLATALGSWLARAHRLGLEDRSPHLRNFLVTPLPGGGWGIEKVDSPRARLHRPPTPPAGRRRDLATLEQEARRHGLDWNRFLAAYTRHP